MSFFGAKSLLNANVRKGWPVASGKILASTVKSSRSKNSEPTYQAKITYEFAVAGRQLTSDNVAYGSSGSGDRSRESEIANRYPPGLAVSVSYSPADPAVCVLEPGLRGETFLLPLVGLGFLAAGIAAFIVVPRKFGGLANR